MSFQDDNKQANRSISKSVNRHNLSMMDNPSIPAVLKEEQGARRVRNKAPASNALIAELRKENKRIQDMISSIQVRKDKKLKDGNKQSEKVPKKSEGIPKEEVKQVVQHKPVQRDRSVSDKLSFQITKPESQEYKVVTANQHPKKAIDKLDLILKQNKDQKIREEERLKHKLKQKQADKERILNSSLHSNRSVHNKSVDKAKELQEADHKVAEELKKKKHMDETNLKILVHELKQANEEGVSKSVSRIKQEKIEKAQQAKREKSEIKEKLNEKSLLAKERQRKQKLMRELEREEKKHLNLVKKIESDMDKQGKEMDKILKIKRESEGFVNKIQIE